MSRATQPGAKPGTSPTGWSQRLPTKRAATARASCSPSCRRRGRCIPTLRERYARSLGVGSLFYPEARLGRLGEQRGFEVIALAPQMQRAADAKHVFLHGFPNTRPGFGHWNEAGHALAAELIAAELCRR